MTEIDTRPEALKDCNKVMTVVTDENGEQRCVTMSGEEAAKLFKAGEMAALTGGLPPIPDMLKAAPTVAVRRGSMPIQNVMRRAHRNEKCPCGSGRKKKNCHKNATYA